MLIISHLTACAIGVMIGLVLAALISANGD